MAGFHCIIDSRLGHSKLDFSSRPGFFQITRGRAGGRSISIILYGVFDRINWHNHYIYGHIYHHAFLEALRLPQ